MPDSGRDSIVKNLNEKLASVLLDCHAKEDVVTENVQMIQESNAGYNHYVYMNFDILITLFCLYRF